MSLRETDVKYVLVDFMEVDGGGEYGLVLKVAKTWVSELSVFMRKTKRKTCREYRMIALYDDKWWNYPEFDQNKLEVPLLDFLNAWYRQREFLNYNKGKLKEINQMEQGTRVPSPTIKPDPPPLRTEKEGDPHVR